MGVHFGLVCFMGDHMDNIPKVLNEINWVYTDRKDFDTYYSALEESNRNNIKYKETFIHSVVATRCNQWTILLDLELELVEDEEILIHLSKMFKTKILTSCTESTSGSYGFKIIQDGEIVRSFMAVEGNIEANTGTPIPEEEGFHINEDIFEDDVFGILEKMGISYEDIYESDQFPASVYYCQLPPQQLEELKEKIRTETEKPKKPKWKFW